MRRSPSQPFNRSPTFCRRALGGRDSHLRRGLPEAQQWRQMPLASRMGRNMAGARARGTWVHSGSAARARDFRPDLATPHSFLAHAPCLVLTAWCSCCSFCCWPLLISCWTRDRLMPWRFTPVFTWPRRALEDEWCQKAWESKVHVDLCTHDGRVPPTPPLNVTAERDQLSARMESRWRFNGRDNVVKARAGTCSAVRRQDRGVERR